MNYEDGKSDIQGRGMVDAEVSNVLGWPWSAGLPHMMQLLSGFDLHSQKMLGGDNLLVIQKQSHK
jgi:hypothetical protein